MNNNGIVNIHGKEYMTVARRVELAHEAKALESVETEVVSHSPIVVKAKVTIKGKVFTGISAVNPDTARMIERQSPYEVAETSAVGRALGFAGYGIIESIASVDEMVKAGAAGTTVQIPTTTLSGVSTKRLEAKDVLCEICGQPATEKKGTTKGGKQYHGVFCSTEDRTHTRWLWN
jgi:hypothetical protein